jgi:hypothetical protein
MPSNIFREIVKRLNAIGIVSLIVENKIVENIHLQLPIFPDEIRTAFSEHEVFK